MIVHCTHDELVDISQLKLNPKNRNIHPKEQIERLAQVLKYQGWRYPVKVSKRSGFVTSGHGRIEAARLNGWEKVPVNFQDYESDEQEYADTISDNSVASWAELDLSGINADLADLGPDFDIDLLGIKDFVLEPAEKFDPQSDEDEVPEVVEPKTKPGDIYQLGRHRLMCGDSTNIEHVERLMNGEKADLIITDPPYNVAYTGKTKDALTIKNDSMSDSEFYQFLFDVYTNLYMVSNDGASIYVFHSDSEGANFRKAMVAAGWKLAQCCVWLKNSLVVGRQDYHSKHEPILYGWKDTASHNWYSDRKQTTVWEFNRPNRNGEHPTMKPVDLIAYPMENSSRGGDVVLDLFGGSGSVLIAAEKLGRKSFLMEIDPHYCDVIVARWEKYTGQKAELLTPAQEAAHG